MSLNIHKIVRGEDLAKWVKDGDARALINELVDMVYEWRQEKTSRRDENRLTFPHPAVVDVSNTTGSALARFSIVQLGGATVVDPTVNLGEFQAGPIFAAVVPTTPPDFYRWGVLLDALPASLPGSSASPVGRAVVSGIVAAQVNFGATTDTLAQPNPGSTTNLVSSSIANPPGVGARIIWPNPAGATGTQWALVQLPATILQPTGQWTAQATDVNIPLVGSTTLNFGITSPGAATLITVVLNVQYQQAGFVGSTQGQVTGALAVDSGSTLVQGQWEGETSANGVQVRGTIVLTFLKNLSLGAHTINVTVSGAISAGTGTLTLLSTASAGSTSVQAVYL